MKLSDNAQKALQCEYPVLVLGGPGSGKTTLSLLKAKKYISKLSSGQSILFLSFSRAAVRQVEIRCRDLLSIDENESVEARTYHSFALDILNTHGKLLTGKPPRIISRNKELILKSRHPELWNKETERIVVEEGSYVFDDFAAAANNLLSRSEAIAKLIAEKYPVVILDEFQDTDEAQWELVKTLSRKSCMMFLADPEQRIFDYNKYVSPKRLCNLRNYLQPIEFDLGEDNHRSPESGILDYSNALRDNKSLPDIPEVKNVLYSGKDFEVMVHAGVRWTLYKLHKRGIETPSIAVLGRTNSMVAKISDCLEQEHKYKDHSLKPIAHAVLWDSALTVAASLVVASILEWPGLSKNDALSQTFKMIAEYFSIKDALNRKGVKYARESSKKFLTEIDRLYNHCAMRYKVTKYFEKKYDNDIHFIGDPREDWKKARSLLDIKTEKLNLIFNDVKFVRLFRMSDQIGGCLSDLWDMRGNYVGASRSLRRPLEMQRLQLEDYKPFSCMLMTVHKAKGKEFDGVVIIDGNPQTYDAFFRFKSSSSDRESSRRLLRVGITRARHQVLLLKHHNSPAMID